MKRTSLLLTAALLLLPMPRLLAGDPKVELQELVEKVKTKLKAGQRTEADLADELKGFDALLAAHQSEKTEDVAHIAMMKAMLYAQVFSDEDKAAEQLKKIQADFPDTASAKQAGGIIDSFAAQAGAKKIQKSLAIGSAFPDFAEKDLDGKPLSLANYKGKIVMVDFWATWCGPCKAELPNVLAAYEKFHSKGFEVVGISLDEDKTKLTNFLKEQKMAWPQYFDGAGWQSKLAAKYGVNSIPATYLLDKDGKILAKDLRGPALDAALTKALQ